MIPIRRQSSRMRRLSISAAFLFARLPALPAFAISSFSGSRTGQRGGGREIPSYASVDITYRFARNPAH
jgi:hypothetical protein